MANHAKENTGIRVNIITLGCSKNLVDSEHLMGQLKAGGMDVMHEKEKDSDITIINTCGFILDAKEESINTILGALEDKKSGKTGRVIVMGCLSERYREELQEEIPEIDGIFGVDQIPEIVAGLGSPYYPLPDNPRILTTDHYAYLKISEGCDRKCSFCAIPLIKGRHRSRPVEDITTEAEMLAGKGVKEIILIAQDLTSYGRDIYRAKSLGTLLGELVKIQGLEWIRLHYAYPEGFPSDVLDIIRDNEKICDYLDIPFQHISDPILKSMKRGVTRKDTYALVDKIRNTIPGIALRTSLMVGYPGETDVQFQALLDFVRDARFERLGVFKYSHEEGTGAYALKDGIPEKVKQSRLSEIMGVQEEISLAANQSMINQVVRVLVDEHDGKNAIGRTQFDSPEIDNNVIIPDYPKSLKTGEFCNVKITSAEPFDLYGMII